MATFPVSVFSDDHALPFVSFRHTHSHICSVRGFVNDSAQNCLKKTICLLANRGVLKPNKIYPVNINYCRPATVVWELNSNPCFRLSISPSFWVVYRQMRYFCNVFLRFIHWTLIESELVIRWSFTAARNRPTRMPCYFTSLFRRYYCYHVVSHSSLLLCFSRSFLFIYYLSYTRIGWNPVHCAW